MQAGEPSTDSMEPKRYRLSICSIFKNEAKFLKEWIEYHQLAGVDHFYLYNLGSQDHSLMVLNPYIKRGIVTLVDWNDFFDDQDVDEVCHWALGTQVAAYEHAIRTRGERETKWLAFINIDEFLVPPGPGTLTEVLEKYDAYPGVTLECDFFDASKLDVLPRRKLMIEALELAEAPPQHPHKRVAKTVFKPELCRGFVWPPYQCVFKGDRTAAVLGKSELRINRYTNRNAGYFFRKFKDRLHIDNRKLVSEEVTQLLALDYEIEDQERAIYRFIPELLKKMGYDPGRDW
jgi:hypothetical protein